MSRLASAIAESSRAPAPLTFASRPGETRGRGIIVALGLLVAVAIGWAPGPRRSLPVADRGANGARSALGVDPGEGERAGKRSGGARQGIAARSASTVNPAFHEMTDGGSR